MRPALAFTIAFLLVGDLAAVRAADQPVLGRSLVVSDPSGGKNHRRRHVFAYALDRGVPVVGDPLTNGLTLEIFTTGASSASQAFVLPPGAFEEPNGPGWKARVRGPRARYVYVDERGENGPVASFYMLGSSFFRMKAIIEARGNNPSVALVPPNPGTGGGMIATIPGGDRYCALFDPSLGAKIRSQNDEELFRIGKVRNRGSCPPP